MSIVRLCGAEEIDEGMARGFRFGSGMDQFAVFVLRRAGMLRAYVNACPHIGTPLDWWPDRFFDRDGMHLLCGTHGALFRPEDGVCIRGPCVGKRLASLPLFVRDGMVEIEVAAA